MKAIITAFKAGSTPEENSRATKSLLRDVLNRGLRHELVVGRYEGVMEVGLCVEGVSTRTVRTWLREYGQKCAVLIHEDGSCNFLTEDSAEVAGTARYGVAALAHENYTQFMDGRVLTIEEDV